MPPRAGKKLEVFDEAAGEHIVPYVIEPAMGVERAVLTVLVDGYAEEQLAKETRVVLRIRPELAPVKAAVLPLLRNRPELVERARRLTADLKPLVAAMYDDTASIGKLYRRQDEIGTPFCVTVDPESLDDGAATIRERDSMTQERVALDRIPQRVADLVAGRATWEGVPREPVAGMTTATDPRDGVIALLRAHDAAFAQGDAHGVRRPLLRRRATPPAAPRSHHRSGRRRGALGRLLRSLRHLRLGHVAGAGGGPRSIAPMTLSTYTETLVPRGEGPRVAVNGRLVAFLRRESDGAWRIEMLMNSHTRPMEDLP